MKGLEMETEVGYERPRAPQDEWVAGLYKKHRVGATPSIREIESKASNY